MARVPELCGPRADGRYYVTDPDTRRPLYLGRDPEEAARRYEHWRQLFLARRDRGGGPRHVATVAELCDAYLEHCRGYYVKRGRVTAEVASISDALKCLAGLAYLPAAQLTPGRLKDARELMVARKGWARGYVNKQVSRVRRMVRWAVEEEIVPADVLHALQAVAPLKKGRTPAREERPVTPVAWEVVEATLPHLRETARSLVLLQWWSGMRAEEAVALRPCDLDRSGLPWVYRVEPDANKTEHLGRERRVPLGPNARSVLEPHLRHVRGPREWLFWSCGRGASAGYRGHVTVNGYQGMVARACVLAGVPHWFPLQLRHAALTRIRARHGLEAAAAIGGHAEVETTQIYAQASTGLADRVAEDMG